MRIAIGNIGHESSSFTPVPTTYQHFVGSKRGFFRGEEVIQHLEGMNVGCGGFIRGAREYGFDLAPLPCGPSVSRQARWKPAAGVG